MINRPIFIRVSVGSLAKGAVKEASVVVGIGITRVELDDLGVVVYGILVLAYFVISRSSPEVEPARFREELYGLVVVLYSPYNLIHRHPGVEIAESA